MALRVADDDLEICLRVLQQIADDPAMMQDHARFKSLIAKIHKVGKKGARRADDQARKQADRALTAQTGLVRGRLDPLEPAPPLPAQTLQQRRTCYCCKRRFAELHHFYHQLCPACAALNYAKRSQRADLRGRVALITGGRVKIGYQTALRMLRDGATVVVTTRFPHDAARRFVAEVDARDWQARLQIYGLDLRLLPAVEAFARELAATQPHLDILINNAAQTIKRPLAYYAQLLAGEQLPRSALPPAARRLIRSAETPHAPLLEQQAGTAPALAAYDAFFPPDAFDRDGQPLDLRSQNSWALRLEHIETVELLEVQLVNAIAPCMLTSMLKPLLERSPFARRFVVNVSAMEGVFAREHKPIFHPHTNMAKAALNMLTRTAAADYAQARIYMNSVDTGWITDEKPHARQLHAREQRGFYPPLDIVDGMARLYDPIARGLSALDEPPSGLFLKDYLPAAW